VRAIAIYAALWAVSGYLLGLAAQSVFSLSSNLGIYCGAANLILGLLALLWVHRSSRLSRLFYVGPRDNERGSSLIAALWSLPIAILFWALVFFIIGWVTRRP